MNARNIKPDDETTISSIFKDSSFSPQNSTATTMTEECDLGYFECKNTFPMVCLQQSEICDGILNCPFPDSSDEERCRKF